MDPTRYVLENSTIHEKKNKLANSMLSFPSASTFDAKLLYGFWMKTVPTIQSESGIIAQTDGIEN